jgi:iron complex transport system substrate-binding protein
MLRSRYCDHPADVVRGVHVVSRSAIPDLRGLSGEQVEAAMQAARRGGLQSAHVLDVEWLRRHRPALVLTQDTCPSCDVSEGTVHHSLDAAGLDRARAVTLNPVTVEQILASMRHLAAALGVDGSHTATAVLAPLESRLQAVAEAVPSTEQRRLRVLGLESVCPLVASGQWLPDMRVRAGGVDALGDEAGSAARRITWEEVEACGAEVIVLCCCGRSADGAAAEVRQHFLPRPGVWKLPAMAATHPRLYVVPHDLFSRPGPRVVDGVEALAGLACTPSGYRRSCSPRHDRWVPCGWLRRRPRQTPVPGSSSPSEWLLRQQRRHRQRQGVRCCPQCAAQRRWLAPTTALCSSSVERSREAARHVAWEHRSADWRLGGLLVVRRPLRPFWRPF